MDKRARYRIGPAGIADVRCGFQRIGQARSQRDSITAQYALIYVSSGSGHYRDEDGREEAFVAPCLLQRRPECLHDLNISSNTAWYYAAIPAPAWLNLRACGVPGLDAAVLPMPDRSSIARRFDQAIARFTHREREAFAHTVHRIADLIVELLTIANQPQGRDPVIEQACDLLADIAERSSLPYIARQLGLSYASFRQRFTEALGMAPGAWRLQRRLERAQELLCEDHSISAIAEELGYGDIYAFSAQFRKHIGCSPSAFRNGLRG